MPQYPYNLNLKSPSGNFEYASADAAGNTMVSTGGISSALNVTAATVIKASPGRICKINILGVVGTGGSLVINDCTTTGAATTANQVASIAGTTAVGGAPITLDFPCQVGIVVSTVPTGGTPHFSISYS